MTEESLEKASSVKTELDKWRSEKKWLEKECSLNALPRSAGHWPSSLSITKTSSCPKRPTRPGLSTSPATSWTARSRRWKKNWRGYEQ